MNKLLNSKINKISNRLASRPAGVTSLLFVLAISLVLIVMVGGIAALTVREQQQASNTELSNRALQTAEAGVKAVVAKLSANPTYSKAGCGSADENALDLGLSISDQTITCATVTSLFSTTYEGFLETDRTTQFIYASSTDTETPAYLKLSWNAPSRGDPAANLAAFAGSLYPATITNNIAYPAAAMVEMNIVYWLKNNVKADGFKNVTLLFAPGNNSNTNNPIANDCPTAGAADGIYSCSTRNETGYIGFDIGRVVNTPSQYNFAIRITPRYKDTHIAFTAYKVNSTTIIPAQSNKAQIDITAKVGNLYRRVKAEKIILPTAIETIFTSTLYAGKGLDDMASYGICKTAVVNATNGTLVNGSPGPCFEPQQP